MLSRQVELRAYVWSLDNEILDRGGKKNLWGTDVYRLRLIEAVGVADGA